ncbi:MAG: 50S ribosomal protein L30 [Myxococcaceae bacterium]|nr:50S ribosomal protein L30 [Myxococcaceae bacterium]
MALKVKLVKSVAGSNNEQRATITGLGLRKLGQERVLEDTPSIRGMVNKVRHLVTAETVSGDAPKRQRMKPRRVRARAARLAHEQQQ